MKRALSEPDNSDILSAITEVLDDFTYHDSDSSDPLQLIQEVRNVCEQAHGNLGELDDKLGEAWTALRQCRAVAVMGGILEIQRICEDALPDGYRE